MEPVFGKVVIAGCMRDCAEHIPAVLQNVERIAALYEQAAFVFVENDSKDDTKAVMKEWCSQRPRAQFLSFDGLGQSRPIRTVRLETARNKFLATTKSDYADYDHLVVLDCDNINTKPMDFTAFSHAIDFLESRTDCAGVFANQDGPYYDMWTLRHPQRCPRDIWEEVFDCASSLGVSDQEAFDRTFARRIFSLPADAEPLEVDSAFGGFGIYKIRSILKNSRAYLGHKRKVVMTPQGPVEAGWQTCEHVAFNAGFREQGEKLFVFPSLINTSTHGMSFPPSAFRHMLFDLRQLLVLGAGNAKIGRNDPCPCGSGKRYKQCHGR